MIFEVNCHPMFYGFELTAEYDLVIQLYSIHKTQSSNIIATSKPSSGTIPTCSGFCSARVRNKTTDLER